MENKKDLMGILFGVFLTISILLGGFVIYDKLIKNNEEKDCPKTECNCEKCEKCEECKECDNTPTECNCPNNSNYGEKISSLKEIKLTDKNQTFKIGKKEVKIRTGKDDDYGKLYVDDELITYSTIYPMNSDDDAVRIDHLYITDRFAFATFIGQFGEELFFAFDGKNEMSVNNNYWQFDTFKIKDGHLHATGMMDCFDGSKNCKDNVDLIIKYIDNTLIVTPFK